MYVATSPRSSGPLAEPMRIPLGLARAEYREFGGGGGFKPEDRVYFTDLMNSFGRVVRPEAFDEGRTTFRDMVEGILPHLSPYNDRFDLALLASVTSDAEPGWPMCYLNYVVQDPGLAYGVADQGASAAFTTLRLAANGARMDRAARILLLMMDQASVPHSSPVPERLLARRNAVAALVLDTTGDLAAVSPGRTSRVAPADVGAALRAELGRAGGPLTLIAGPGLKPFLAEQSQAELGAELITAPDGLPCTGIWSEFIRELPAWRVSGRRVALADYDLDARWLSLCTIDVAQENTNWEGCG